MSVFANPKDGGGIQFDVASSLNFKMIRENRDRRWQDEALFEIYEQRATRSRTPVTMET
jgi:hypothetical protein